MIDLKKTIAWAREHAHMYGADPSTLFIAHGDLDPLVPVSDIRKVAEQLRRASSYPVVYTELRVGHHAFDLYHSLRFEAVVDAIEAFAAWARSRGRTLRP